MLARKLPAGRPYYALKRVIRRDAGMFPVGVASVEIGGFWGYRDLHGAVGNLHGDGWVAR